MKQGERRKKGNGTEKRAPGEMMMKNRTRSVCRGVVLGVSTVLLMAAFVATPSAVASNIIGFANNATKCGGAVLCSTTAGPLVTGTQGYFETGPSSTNPAFNLSTINSWFQIDAGSTSYLPDQPVEPLGGAGNFLVYDDLPGTTKSFSLILNTTFTASTAGVVNCDMKGGPSTEECDNFQIHSGAANYFSSLTVTGTCYNGAGTDSAWCAPGQVSYNWSAGTDAGVAFGDTFNLNFASWSSSVYTTPTAPEASALALTGLVLLAFGATAVWVRRKERA